MNVTFRPNGGKGKALTRIRTHAQAQAHQTASAPHSRGQSADYFNGLIRMADMHCQECLYNLLIHYAYECGSAV